tara:strand:+ start:377 stop:811 length:435 start_codon:yes stop_codon:yes gene_type:complete
MSLKNTVFAIFSGFVICLALFSCKSFKAQKSKKIILVEGYKTPVIGGAGTRGMKITLTIKTEGDVELKSIEYNKLINSLTVTKTDKKAVTAECYFYDKNERTVSGNTNYKAEGDSCILHYICKGVAKKLVCENLKELKDSSLWE